MVQIGRIMALLRHREFRVCAWPECGRSVLMLAVQRYCCEACKQRAKRRRLAQTI